MIAIVTLSPFIVTVEANIDRGNLPTYNSIQSEFKKKDYRIFRNARKRSSKCVQYSRSRYEKKFLKLSTTMVIG
jgi:hypothetical protein